MREGPTPKEEQGRRHGQMSRSEKRRSRRRRSRRTMAVMAAIIGLTAVSGIGAVTFARYVGGYESRWLQIKPEKFYFTSDQLNRKGDAVIDLYNWNQEEDYLFFMDIRNWEDDLRVSEGPVIYSVTVEGADGIKSAVAQPGNDMKTQDSYELPGNLPATQKLVITVPGGVTPVDNQVKVKVKARPEGGKGYTRTLSGKFTLNKGAQTVEAEVEVHNAYIDLLIGVDKGQSLKVEWPSCLTPDNTNRWLTQAVGTDCEVTLEERSSCRLRFIVTGTVGSGDHFTVTENGGAGKANSVPISR